MRTCVSASVCVHACERVSMPVTRYVRGQGGPVHSSIFMCVTASPPLVVGHFRCFVRSPSWPQGASHADQSDHGHG